MSDNVTMRSTTERRLIEGVTRGSQIEIAIDSPVNGVKGVALVAHPHPLHGGSLDNKVTQTIARSCVEQGYLAIRPNSRGVGQSSGSFDHGIGEQADLIKVWHQVAQTGLPLVIAGFSFGSYIATQVFAQLHQKQVAISHLILVAPAVHLYEFAPVPQGTLIAHGSKDEVVALETVLTWAQTQQTSVNVFAGVSHFFHRSLPQLKALVSQYLSSNGVIRS